MADGPLAGVRVLEIGGQGPVPFCAMTLADLGADIITLHRPGPPLPTNPPNPVINRGRRSIVVDLKAPEGVAVVKRLVGRADVTLEGFRPGVLERLGLGPSDCLAVNPALVYGRVTGWGQEGPWAQRAGHDINYIALTGALHAIGPDGGEPVVPLNLVGDYAGGALYLALGVTSALLVARTSGRGQVIDAAMVDGVATLMSIVYGLSAIGNWSGDRGRNLLDGGAPFYSVYRCADNEYVAVGALEEPFYLELLDGLGLSDHADLVSDRLSPHTWPKIRDALTQSFAAHPRSHWAAVFENRDACVTPVLSAVEASAHPHHVARLTYLSDGGDSTNAMADLHAAPAPRFSGTPASSASPSAPPGADTLAVLGECGYDDAEITRLVADGVVELAHT